MDISKPCRRTYLSSGRINFFFLVLYFHSEINLWRIILYYTCKAPCIHHHTMLACEHYTDPCEEFCLWTKKALQGRFTSRFTKSYKVEIPAILQKKPKKIAVKKFEIGDCRSHQFGVWTRTQADVRQKGWKGKR